jgi:hypothetical protein
VPLLGFVDFGFHELGHTVMYVFPINEVLTAAMGSIAQCAIPGGLAAYFWFGRGDGVGACACLAWSATNLRDVSVYIADAPYERLELVGGQHDWAFILGREHFNRLDDAATIASVVRGAGVVLLLFATACALCALLRPGTTGTATVIPVGPTGWRSDDLYPNMSRMPSADPAHPSTRSWSSDRR